MDLSNLPAAIFSPAKMIYIGYIVLVSLERIESSLTQFILISLAFLVVQAGHDDYLRIKLNYWAQPKDKRSS